MTIALFIRPLARPFVEFFRREAAGGIILLASAVLALVLANATWGPARYFPALWDEHLRVAAAGFVLDLTLAQWINDGLMTVFFLIVGLEIKREVLAGALASGHQAALPVAGAVGGMLAPALLFTLLNHGTPTAGGWGIPMATDIAFALAVLQLLGPRVPLGLKVFLTALAIADDLGAVLVIAGFYTQTLHVTFLCLALGIWLLLLIFNWLRVRSLWAYLPLGGVLWYCMLASGVHATLAGVLLAGAIPFRLPSLPKERPAQMREPEATEKLAPLLPHDSPAQWLEQHLHAAVSFGIIPLFAFANTSLVIEPAALRGLLTPLGLGILLGLVVGKPLGIGLLSWVTIKLGWAALPPGVSWRHLWGAGVLGGIGFTMSIFVTLLALGEQSLHTDIAKLAILLASLTAGSLGYALLRSAPAGPPSP